MHTPSYYKIDDEKLIDQFLRDYSFGTLISAGSSYPLATHIPMELEINTLGKSVLRGHISKANPQWHSWASHPQVLAVFLSPIHHYISSSWYNHPNVPTWNYMSVHISGELSILEGEDLKESLRRLTDKYEKDSRNPVSLDQLPVPVQNQINGIVGFEIQINRKEASFKLSQNRNEEDFLTIINELKNSGKPQAIQLAEIMEQIK
ncbi:MAG: FMN-binding negative transcriptional regulator [Saprospiraceae bacterium]|nr:FMN-binding negative transcriptional regulator [Saprospiraceae bacterium]